VKCNGIEVRREVLTAAFPVEVQGDDAVHVVRAHFIEEYLEPESVEKLELHEMPHGQRFVLNDDETVHFSGTVLMEVQLDERAGIEVDHPRRSRCSRTISEPFRPVFLCAVARWSGHRNTCRGVGGTT
jgi:L-ascorbate metabolism protein UlaG (beta-lactamase superfamily)